MEIEKFIPWKELGEKEKDGFHLTFDFTKVKEYKLSDIIDYLEEFKKINGDCIVLNRYEAYPKIHFSLYKELKGKEFVEREMMRKSDFIRRLHKVNYRLSIIIRDKKYSCNKLKEESRDIRYQNRLERLRFYENWSNRIHEFLNKVKKDNLDVDMIQKFYNENRD